MDKTVNASPLQTILDPNISIVSTDQPTSELNPNKANNRKSSGPKKEMKRYGDLTNLDFLDSSDDEKQPHKRHAESVASYSPPKASTSDTPASPARSTIPVSSTSHRNINTGYQQILRTKPTSLIPVTTTQAKTTKTTSYTSGPTSSNSPPPKNVYVKNSKIFVGLKHKQIEIKNCRSYIMLNCLT